MRKRIDTNNETKTHSRATPVTEKSHDKLTLITQQSCPVSSVSLSGLSGLKVALLLCIIYFSVPVILCLFPWILGHVIYLHWVRFPYFVDLANPAQLSLNHTVNFYLSPEEGISLGIWHTVPDSQWEHAQGEGPEWYSESLRDGSSVIIYLHGNGGSRAVNHRVQLVKVLSAAGYHVLSLDYRGYGDSSGVPSEAGMTSDALYLYQWVKTCSGNSPVYLWGHSLGTGVASNAALNIQKTHQHEMGFEKAGPQDLFESVKDVARSYGVDGVILEAPFTNIQEEVASHPLCMMYRYLPGFQSVLHYIMQRNNMVFANDENLQRLSTRVLLLHAEDDSTVPFQMSQKLYQIASRAHRQWNREEQVAMVTYGEPLGYSHNNIYLDPSLSTVVGHFLQGFGLQRMTQRMMESPVGRILNVPC